MARRGRCEIRGPGGSLPLRLDDRAAQDLALLIEGETSGRQLEEVLVELGCSRSNYYEKLRRFREGGLAALLPLPPGPHGPRRRTPDVVSFIVRARLQDPRRNAASIVEELAAQGMPVGVRSVERTLAQFGLTTPRGGR